MPALCSARVLQSILGPSPAVQPTVPCCAIPSPAAWANSERLDILGMLDGPSGLVQLAVGSDDALQYDELESQAQTLESGTTYRVRIGNDSTFTEVDGSKLLSTWCLVLPCCYISCILCMFVITAI